MIIYDDLALEAWTQRQERDVDVGVICGEIYDDGALQACTQRKRERETKKEGGREMLMLVLVSYVGK